MISLKNVDFIYNNAKADIGVHQIDLEISKGEVVLLCGSSGCGKTTLTRMINGLIPNFYEGKLSHSQRIDFFDEVWIINYE